MEFLAEKILTFWFGDIDETGAVDKEVSKRWFVKDQQFDDQVKRVFGSYLETGVMGAYDRWIHEPGGLAALIVMLDQFPRQIFRNRPEGFVYDPKALSLSLFGIENECYLKTRTYYGNFILMPTMHSEDLKVQDLGVSSFKSLLDVAEPGAKNDIANALEYAIKHRDIIAKFGRFPHRNAILNRESTSEEIEFLKTPGSSF